MNGQKKKKKKRKKKDGKLDSKDCVKTLHLISIYRHLTILTLVAFNTIVSLYEPRQANLYLGAFRHDKF